jgi:flagellar L-ring protein precursor FlgH
MTPPAPPIGVLTQRAGGSLMRAMLNTQAEPGTVQCATASYIAVPDPKPKLLHKHDLVTIVVNETSAYAANGTSDLKKNADFDWQVPNYLRLRLMHLALIGQNPTNPLELKSTAQRDVKGTAQLERDDTMTARITATVIDVKPNGTLVLEASEEIVVDDEEQKIILTGVCRVDDVTADNTVLSTQLYDLNLTKKHRGAVVDTTKRGLVPRLLDWIDPF